MIHLIRMKKIFFSIVSPILMFPIVAHALTLENPLGNTGVNSISALIDKITTALVEAAAPIVTIMVLVGAFKMLTAGDNETKFQDGKKTITYAVIGMAVVLLAKGIELVIKDFFGVK